MNKLDKKQIPQFAALCVLSAGVFGYFVMKIVTPSPAAAGTRPHPAIQVLQASSAEATSPTSTSPIGAKPAAVGKAGAVPADATADDEAPAPAPTPGMRDPFVIGYVDPATASPAAPPAPKPVSAAISTKAISPAKTTATQVASIHEVAPASIGTPALPFGLKGFPAPGSLPGLPAVAKKTAPDIPAAPAWTVTGVLQSAAGQMAVLRDGEARRIVHTGDSVDGLYRVVTVTRSAVVLRHGVTLYHLTLGATKAAPTAPARPALSPFPAAAPAPVPTAASPVPIAPPVATPKEDAQVPAGPPAALEAGLARMVQGALLMARSYLTPAEDRMDTCFAAPPMPLQETALAPVGPAPLDLSRDVYEGGQAAEGGAPWRCVTAYDPTAPDATGEMPTRFI